MIGEDEVLFDRNQQPDDEYKKFYPVSTMYLIDMDLKSFFFGIFK